MDVVRNLAKVEGGSKHFVFVSSAETAATALEAAVADPGGDLAHDVAELASVARLGNVTMRVVDVAIPQCKRASTPEVVRVALLHAQCHGRVEGCGATRGPIG